MKRFLKVITVVPVIIEAVLKLIESLKGKKK